MLRQRMWGLAGLLATLGTGALVAPEVSLVPATLLPLAFEGPLGPAAVLVEAASQDDMGSVAGLLVESFFEVAEPTLVAVATARELARLRRHHGGEGHVQLLAYEGGRSTKELVGFVDLDVRDRQGEPRPYVSDLAVRPDKRRRGIATTLLTLCEDLCVLRYDKEELFLKVHEDNGAALAVYAKRGFEVVHGLEGGKALLRKRLFL